MNVKYTQGPWHVATGKCGYYINRANQQSVAVTVRDSWQTEDEEKANAELIARAPEMDAELQKLRKEVYELLDSVERFVEMFGPIAVPGTEGAEWIAKCVKAIQSAKQQPSAPTA